MIREQPERGGEAGVHVEAGGQVVEDDIVAPVEALEVEGEGGRGLDR